MGAGRPGHPAVGGSACRSSYKGRAVDALGARAEEGRGMAAKRAGELPSKLIRRYPNGATRLA